MPNLLFCQRSLIAALSVVLSAAAHSQTTTIYDADAGSSITDQGWIILQNPVLGATTTITQNAGSFFQNSSASAAESSGVFSRTPVPALISDSGTPAYPALDRTVGYTLSFDLRLDAESHTGSNRAGLSVIVIGDDLQGIELGFWEDAIWAYDTDGSTGFTKAETASRAVVATNSTQRTLYDLNVLGNAYALFADNQLVLQGNLRDYSGFPGTGPSNLVNPYNKPNLIFIGDDTSQASSIFDLRDVAVTIPEPASAVLCLMTLALTQRRTKRRDLSRVG